MSNDCNTKNIAAQELTDAAESTAVRAEESGVFLSKQQAILDSLEKENKELAKEVASLKQRSIHISDKATDLGRGQEQIVLELAAKRKIVDDLETDERNADLNLAKRATEITDLKKKQEELDDTVEEQTIALEVQQKQLERVQDGIAYTKSALIIAESEVNERSAFFGALNQELRSASSCEAAERKELEKAKHIWWNKKQMCDIKKMDIPSLQSRLEEAETSLSSCKKTTASTLATEEQLNNQLHRVIDEALQNLDIGMHKQDALRDLNEALEQKELEIKQWVMEEDKVRGMCSQLCAQIESLIRKAKERDSTKKELGEQKKAKEAVVAESTRQLKSLSTSWRLLQSFLNKVGDDCNKLEDESSIQCLASQRLQQNLVPLKHDLESLQKRSVLLHNLLAQEKDVFHISRGLLSHLRFELQNSGTSQKKKKVEAEMQSLEIWRLQRTKQHLNVECSQLDTALSKCNRTCKLQEELIIKREEALLAMQERTKESRMYVVEAKKQQKEKVKAIKRLTEKVSLLCTSS
jgi:chromosome segregation ATPase